MKRMKSMAILMVIMMIILVGCGSKEVSSDKDKVYHIGVNQLATHAALDASYEGFVDALKDAGYIDGDNIVIDHQNAQGDQPTANTIASKLVNDNNDLILAIATPSAQAMMTATKDIPILITAVTDPAGSKLVASNEVPGGNISGTSDLTPVKKQLELLKQLIPDAKTIAVLYCSSESNSKIQYDIAVKEATAAGIEVVEATVADANEISQVVESLIGKVDAIYAPTDNTIAEGMAKVAQVANENGIPVICGEGGMVENGGLATYGISYYELGRLTGEQAVKILKGEATTDKMPIGYYPEDKCELVINEDVAAQLGIEIPEELKAELKAE